MPGSLICQVTPCKRNCKSELRKFFEINFRVGYSRKIFPYIYIYIYVCVSVCVCVCVCVWHKTDWQTHTHTHTHTYIYICVCVCVCVCLCVCVSVFETRQTHTYNWNCPLWKEHLIWQRFIWHSTVLKYDTRSSYGGGSERIAGTKILESVGIPLTMRLRHLAINSPTSWQRPGWGGPWGQDVIVSKQLSGTNASRLAQKPVAETTITMTSRMHLFKD